MTSFNLNLSAFSVCWLRAYDFGLEREALKSAVVHLKNCPLVEHLRHVANAAEIDDADSRMFDIRYQERSNLVRIRFKSFEFVDQDLGIERKRSGKVIVNLMLDLGSGFGVLNLCLPQVQAQGADAFMLEEIGFLTRQWLLPQDDQGQPLRLNIKLPQHDQVVPMYVREVMNFYYLQVHRVLWEAARPQLRSPLQNFKEFADWLGASHEAEPAGCECLRELNRLGFIRSLFPTSFGPVLDIWGMEGIDPDLFEANSFVGQHSAEIAWLFTDGQRTTLGEGLHNERQTKSLAFFMWPNHALYINQNRVSISPKRVHSRVSNYGCLDVEIIRILEIINLQNALLHAFDTLLDQQLEQISSLNAKDQSAIIKITEQRSDISQSLRSFDFFNLFHTAYWEPLYSRLLENPRLRHHEAVSLVEMKSARLDEEIQRAIIIQDRSRQQQQREQELDVLRGLHSLSLANDIQSNALSIINVVVSATASFGFTAILGPLLTSLSAAQPSFEDAYPLMWIGLNVGVFSIVTVILSKVSASLVARKHHLVELHGHLDLHYNGANLEAYLAQLQTFEFIHLDTDDLSGYFRIKKPSGTLIFEFDRERIYRYILFLQGIERFDRARLKEAYIDQELQNLRQWQVIS